MKPLLTFINESCCNIAPKPIHLFKNDNTFIDSKTFSNCIDNLKSIWEPAVCSDHEDEYLYIDSNNPMYQSLCDKYCDVKNIKDGVSTRGIGTNYFGWHKYITDKKQYPIYRVFKGTNDRHKINSVFIADKHFFQ